MRLACWFGHRYVRRLEFTPLVDFDDEYSLTNIKVVDIHTCSRCSKEKRTTETIPFTYVVDDGE